MSVIGRRQVLTLLLAATATATAPVPAASASDELSLVELPGAVQAPDFSLPSLDAKRVSLSSYRSRPVLVSFWAVWCPPCRRELAALADLRRRVSDTPIALFAINLGDSPDRIRNFLTAHPAPGLPVLLDADKSTVASWHVQGLPVAYAIDRDGRLRLGALGERDWRSATIERQLRALI